MYSPVWIGSLKVWIFERLRDMNDSDDRARSYDNCYDISLDSNTVSVNRSVRYLWECYLHRRLLFLGAHCTSWQANVSIEFWKLALVYSHDSIDLNLWKCEYLGGAQAWDSVHSAIQRWQDMIIWWLLSYLPKIILILSLAQCDRASYLYYHRLFFPRTHYTSWLANWSTRFHFF